MATTPIQMYAGPLSNNNSTLYTAPGTGTTIITNVSVTNSSNVNAYANLSIGYSADSYATFYQATATSLATSNVVYNQVLPANQSIVGNSWGNYPGAWSGVTNPVSQSFNCLATNNKGTWVAVGNGVTSANTFAYSTDNGVTWSSGTISTSAVWSSVAYGNGYFLAIAGSGTKTGTGISNVVAYSSDGITWTTATNTLPSTTTWVSLAFNNGTFVAIAGAGTASNAAAYCTNPANGTWTASTLTSSSTWKSIAGGNGVFIAVTNVSSTRYSISTNNGATWSTGAFNTAGWNTIVYGGGQFGIISTTNAAATAVLQYSNNNGQTWTYGASVTSGVYTELAYANGWWVLSSGTNTYVTANTIANTLSSLIPSNPLITTNGTTVGGGGTFVSINSGNASILPITQNGNQVNVVISGVNIV